MVERAIKTRRHRPIVMVDLAVPRDIEREVAELDDVFLYRRRPSPGRRVGPRVEAGGGGRGGSIINSQVDGFRTGWRRDAVPTIRALREHAETLRKTEMERALKLLARGESPERVIEALSHGLANKLMHGPTQYLNRSEGERLGEAMRVLHHLFDLNRRG